MMTTATKTLKLDTVTGQACYLGISGAWEALLQGTSGGSSAKSSEHHNTLASFLETVKQTAEAGRRPYSRYSRRNFHKRVGPNDPLYSPSRAGAGNG
jgi:hypothetical protein